MTCLAVDDLVIDNLTVDMPAELYPVEVKSDGNCLPSCGSVFAYGNPNHTSEMRVRIIHELCLYFWLLGCFGFNGPLRQYFSLYRAVSQREGEREEKR